MLPICRLFDAIRRPAVAPRMRRIERRFDADWANEWPMGDSRRAVSRSARLATDRV
jgi:hypothetical protein